MYSIIHIIPILIFKFRDLKDKKIHLMMETLIKILKSVSFFVGFHVNFRIVSCFLNKFSYFLNEGQFLKLLIMCFFGCLASLYDSHERIIDYACYTFPRAVEGLWDLMRKLNIVGDIPLGDKFLFAILIGFSVLFMKHYNENVPKNYRNIYKLFFGNEI